MYRVYVSKALQIICVERNLKTKEVRGRIAASQDTVAEGNMLNEPKLVNQE